MFRGAVLKVGELGCVWTDHIDEKAAFISYTSTVLGDDIGTSEADLKAQQVLTKMLKVQIRVLLPLK